MDDISSFPPWRRACTVGSMDAAAQLEIQSWPNSVSEDDVMARKEGKLPAHSPMTGAALAKPGFGAVACDFHMARAEATADFSAACGHAPIFVTGVIDAAISPLALTPKRTFIQMRDDAALASQKATA